MPLEISIRFPYTDLPEVVERLRAAARELTDAAPGQSPDESPDHGESNGRP
jgi:hypothetical protein